jgi:hypothetical protein
MPKTVAVAPRARLAGDDQTGNMLAIRRMWPNVRPLAARYI